MRRFLFLLFCFLVGFALGCATSSRYAGPVADRPLLSVSYMRHVMHTPDARQIPYVETIATANVTNPSDHPMVVVLDCTETRRSLTIAPRTTEHVLLDPKDASCEVTR
jgi:hypothetical protein